MKTIRQLRLERGLTQEILARQLNLHQSTIAHYEKGIRIPSIKTAKKIAGYFGVGLDDIKFVA